MESEFIIQFNGSLKMTKSIFFFQFLRVLLPIFKIGADLKLFRRVLQNSGVALILTRISNSQIYTPTYNLIDLR